MPESLSSKQSRSRFFKNYRQLAFFVAALAWVFLMAPAKAQVASSGEKLVNAARRQIGVTLAYDPDYTVLAYPGGDVPRERGVCTDVVIRALRESVGLDLQKLVHEDMQKNFSAYPKAWGLRRPDANIDHRRVPNLQTFFRRQGWSLPLNKDMGDFHPGDLVTVVLPGNLPHIMIVSDRRDTQGVPGVIHNIGHGASEEDRLLTFTMTGHYRVLIP